MPLLMMNELMKLDSTGAEDVILDVALAAAALRWEA